MYVTGFTITAAEISAQVAAFLTSSATTGWTNLGTVLGGLRNTPELRWANPLEVKNAVEVAFTDKFGVKETSKPKGKVLISIPKAVSGFRSDPAVPTLKETKKDVQKKPSQTTEAPVSIVSTSNSVFSEGFLGHLHKPGGNPQIHPHLREAHLTATGGLVYTRFPPEPNGYLHVGHSKAIFINFGFAAFHGGKCYLRFDDTNPEAEEGRYFESILETIRWLGFEPWKITYSSDYFDNLYQLALELIKRDKAYVCHCTGMSSMTKHMPNIFTILGEEIRANRGGDERGPRKACSHRTRPVTESTSEFERMKNGEYKPGEAILRMKQDLDSGNTMMWDLVAYRVLSAPHHRTHDKWRVYPTYDFTHCLCDSFENISYVPLPQKVSRRLTNDFTCLVTRSALRSSLRHASHMIGYAMLSRFTNQDNRNTAV